MMPPEEVLRNIEYIRCPVCFGDRVVHLPYLTQRCTRCDGWGYVVDPADPEERMRIGLAAIGGAAIELLS